MLVEQDVVLDKNENVAEVINRFFTNVVSNLNISTYHNQSVNINHIEDPITRSTVQYKNHPSLVAIKNNSTYNYFAFNSTSKPKLRSKY